MKHRTDILAVRNELEETEIGQAILLYELLSKKQDGRTDGVDWLIPLRLLRLIEHLWC